MWDERKPKRLDLFAATFLCSASRIFGARLPLLCEQPFAEAIERASLFGQPLLAKHALAARVSRVARQINAASPPFLFLCSQVPEGHRERMRLAEMSFFWHRVYNPRTKTCVHFCDAAPELIGTADVPALPSTAGGMAFLGCVIFFGCWWFRTMQVLKQ